MAFLVPVFFLPFSYEAFNFNKIYLLFALTAVGILAWLGQMIFKDKKIVLKKSPLNIAVLAFLAVMVVGYFFSKDKITTLWGSYGSFWPSLLGVFIMGGVYLLTANAGVGKNGEETETTLAWEGSKIIQWFMWGGLVTLVSSYLAIFGVWNALSNALGNVSAKLALPFVMLSRNFSFAGASLEGLGVFATFLMFIGFLILANKNDVTKTKTERKANKQKPKANRQGNLAFVSYGLVFLGLGILAIIDVSFVWLLLAMGLAIFIGVALWKRLFKENVNRLGLPIFCLLVCIVFLLSNPLTGFLSKAGVADNLSSEVLLKQIPSWKVAMFSLKESPVLGSGLGNFSYSFAKHKPSSFLLNNPLWYLRLDKPGNFMAEILTETGALGFLSYLAIFVVLLWLVLKKIKKSAQEFKENKWLLPVLLGCLFLAASQFFYYQNIVLAFAFWLMLGLTTAMAGAQGEQGERGFSFKKYPEVGLVFSIVFWILVVGFAFLGFVLTQQYIADVNYNAYLMSPQDNLTKLEKAVRFGGSRSVYTIVLSRAYLTDFIAQAQSENPDATKIESSVALAINTARKAVEKSPNSIFALETAALVYREIQGVAQGADEWAQKTIEQALLLEPKNPSLITELGKLKVKEDEQGAIALFEKALSLKPDFSEAVLQLALLDEQNENIDKAIQRLEQLIAVSQYEVEVRFHLGRLYYNEGRLEDAKTQFVIALQLFPNHSNSLYSLALLLEKQGDRENALLFLQKVLELNPNNKDIKAKINELQ